MRNGFRRLLVVWALSCGLPACTSSHDVEGSGQALTGGTGGGGVQGGRAASGGQGGRASAAGTGGRATGSGGRAGAAAVSCGGMTCPGSSVFGFSLSGCCTEADKCGLDLAAVGFGGCEEANAPGSANAACPSQTIAGILPLAGCCKPDRTCGALDTYLGLGCVSLGESAASCTP